MSINFHPNILNFHMCLFGYSFTQKKSEQLNHILIPATKGINVDDYINAVFVCKYDLMLIENDGRKEEGSIFFTTDEKLEHQHKIGITTKWFLEKGSIFYFQDKKLRLVERVQIDVVGTKVILSFEKDDFMGAAYDAKEKVMVQKDNVFVAVETKNKMLCGWKMLESVVEIKNNKFMINNMLSKKGMRVFSNSKDEKVYKEFVENAEEFWFLNEKVIGDVINKKEARIERKFTSGDKINTIDILRPAKGVETIEVNLSDKAREFAFSEM